MSKPIENDSLVQRLLDLDRNDVLEAALALRGPGSEQASGEEAEAFLAQVEAAPLAAIEEVEELARAALIAAALDPERRQTIEAVIDRVGEKGFIFGGAEIVLAGVVAVTILQTVFAKGRTSEEETVEIIDDDAGVRIVHRRKTAYGLSSGVGGLLSSILSGFK